MSIENGWACVVADDHVTLFFRQPVQGCQLAGQALAYTLVAVAAENEISIVICSSRYERLHACAQIKILSEAVPQETNGKIVPLIAVTSHHKATHGSALPRLARSWPARQVAGCGNNDFFHGEQKITDEGRCSATSRFIGSLPFFLKRIA